MEALSLILPILFVFFLGLEARVLWRNYFSRDFEASFPSLMKHCTRCYCPRGWERPVRRALRELLRLQRREAPDLLVEEVKEASVDAIIGEFVACRTSTP